MSKRNPAVRTGLIWAGGHQAFALLFLWTSRDALFPVIKLLFVADSPALFVASALGLPLWNPTGLNSLVTGSSTPNFSGFIVWVLIFGAAQWFAVGYLFTAYLNRRGPKQKEQNLSSVGARSQNGRVNPLK